MRWAAVNMLGGGAWLLGIFCAKAPQFAAFDGFGHQTAASFALAGAGAVILLWANLRSAT